MRTWSSHVDWKQKQKKKKKKKKKYVLYIGRVQFEF